MFEEFTVDRVLTGPDATHKVQRTFHLFKEQQLFHEPGIWIGLNSDTAYLFKSLDTIEEERNKIRFSTVLELQALPPK